jgi:transient receptor potential cation channel subfamily A protein 1
MAGRASLPRSPPKTTLQQAAWNGHKDVVNQHLVLLVSENNKEKVLNAKDADGYTALHYAAKFNRFNILKLLREAGANAMQKTTHEQLTALHLSARYLPHFQDPDAEAHDHVDSQEDNSASTSRCVTQYLIKECRVHVNVQDIYGVTPLHMACSRGNLAALEALIEAPDIQLNISDNNQDTPLHEACLAGHPDVIETLLKKMNEKHIPLSLENDEKQTPLHFACKEGLDVVVKLILQYGDDRLVHTEDNEHNSPLHLACESGNEAVVDTLLQNGANVMAVKENEITPLHIAARLGFVEIAKMLVAKKKAIVRASDVSQQTPLHYAAQYNQCCMINFLLDQCLYGERFSRR